MGASELEKIKKALEASKLSRRDVLTAALSACGALLVVLVSETVDAQALKPHGPAREQEPTDCTGSCANACVTCRDGCSNGPDK